MKIFLKNWLFDCCMKETSDAIVEIGGEALYCGEFLQYIGIWSLLVTSVGWNCVDHWSTSPHSQQEHLCPYTFLPLMRRKHLEEITWKLQFTFSDCPEFCDIFWEVHEMIDAWNKNIELHFILSWVLCLDESMSIWFQHSTCLGWVFCPRKPHPFGNEYQTACCGLTGILFSLKIMEGNDCPKELAAPRFDKLGKTVGLIL